MGAEEHMNDSELLEIVKALYLWHKHYDGQLDHCAPATHAEQWLSENGLKQDLDKEPTRL